MKTVYVIAQGEAAPDGTLSLRGCYRGEFIEHKFHSKASQLFSVDSSQASETLKLLSKRIGVPVRRSNPVTLGRSLARLPSGATAVVCCEDPRILAASLGVKSPTMCPSGDFELVFHADDRKSTRHFIQ